MNPLLAFELCYGVRRVRKLLSPLEIFLKAFGSAILKKTRTSSTLLMVTDYTTPIISLLRTEGHIYKETFQFPWKRQFGFSFILVLKPRAPRDSKLNHHTKLSQEPPIKREDKEGSFRFWCGRKTMSLQRKLFLTINLSPLLVIKKGFMIIIIFNILSNYYQ